MCGIVGAYFKTDLSDDFSEALHSAGETLNSRGPDAGAEFLEKHIGLAHRRLSILDTSEKANQPFFSDDKRFVIIYNGEIFNFKALKKTLQQKGHKFKTESDTEVLLKAYLSYGKECLEHLNGFFAFAIHDRDKNSLFVARDRFGIKPLVYYNDDRIFCFGSEIKSLIPLGIKRELNYSALFTYLQLSYVPQPISMLKNVRKLSPGHYIEIADLNDIPEPLVSTSYYQIENARQKEASETNAKDYINKKEELRNLLEESIEKRLVSDVPIGTFLSGGIDSSVISAIAAKKKKDLKTFSIGFSDEKYFDETDYAKRVADKIGSEHRVFSLSNHDLYDALLNTLDYLDEPFADSSALAVNVLCERTSEYVKVALSGDGADELFSGYNKHAAEFRIRYPQLGDKVLPLAGALLPYLPKSRNTRLGNMGRQLSKYLAGNKLSNQERYWFWASIQSEEEANYFIKEGPQVRQQRLSDEAFAYKKLKEGWLKPIQKNGNLNDVLRADQQLVLANDMLRKVDSMSMAHSLEVRTPFLDHKVVEFANRLPVEYKINPRIRKRILQDTFRKDLPDELYNRPKAGFEVPLLNWFKTELKPLIEDELLSEAFVEEQGLFNPEAIRTLRQSLFSRQPGDAAAITWSLLVFQYWWKKYMADA